MRYTATQSDTMPPKRETREYEVGDKILCLHSGKIFYAAKIIEMKQDKGEIVYKIHYQGWNSRYDEEIRASETSTKWKPFTEDEHEKAKTVEKEVLNSHKKKRIRPLNKDEMHKSEGGSNSRASTPSQTGSNRDSTYSKKAKGVSGTPSAPNANRRSEQPHIELPIADFIRGRKEVNISIPDVLKQVMVDDYDQVTRQYRLNALPAKYSVEQIVKEYANSLGRPVCRDEQIVVHYSDAMADADLVSSHATMMECTLGLQDFFDVTFGSHLLTKFERPQYVEFLEKSKAKKDSEPPSKKRRTRLDAPDDSLAESFRPSTVYGITHLLRLFVRFGTLIQCSPWSDRALASIIRHVHDFLIFLARNVDKFYVKDAYDTASTEYQRKAFT